MRAHRPLAFPDMLPSDRIPTSSQRDHTLTSRQMRSRPQLIQSAKIALFHD